MLSVDLLSLPLSFACLSSSLTRLRVLCSLRRAAPQGETDQVNAFVLDFIKKRQQLLALGVPDGGIGGVAATLSDTQGTVSKKGANGRGVAKSRAVVGRARRRRPPAPARGKK